MTTLEGLLVDLVPYGQAFLEREQAWENSIAGFWASAGEHTTYTRAQFERWRTEAAQRTAPRLGVRFGIRAKDGTLLGSIGMGDVHPHHRLAMVGAMIGEPAYWGGGYGTDALLLFVDYAFGWLDMRKLWLSTMGINARVLRQMEKIGIPCEGRRRSLWFVDGQYVDDVVFGILREEWPGRAAIIERIGLRPAEERSPAGEPASG